jgi:hypothetical protein
MFSEALQRNAKHEARLSNIAASLRVPRTTNKSLKAWPRGFCPLRRGFASLKTTPRTVQILPSFIRPASLVMFWVQAGSRTTI